MTAVAPRLDPRSPVARLELLVDPGTLGPLVPGGPQPEADGSGVTAGVGTVHGTPVVVFASDPTVQGGAMGSAGCEAIVAATDTAVRLGRPVIGLWHSGGARLQEGVASLDAVGKVFAAQVRASGRVPQLSVVLGPAAGGAAYGPALTDVVILGPNGRVFVTGPDVVRSVTGEDVDAMRLGGPEPHGRRSGVVAITTDTDADALEATRSVAVLLGQQGGFAVLDTDGVDGMGHGPGGPRDPSTLLPESVRRAYDVTPVVSAVLDAGSGVELHQRWAPNITTTLGRLAGRTVGVLANNPLRLGGCLDSASAEKAARFVRMCDAFGVPLVVLVDVPGYLPGVAQEWDGVVRRGAKLLHAFAEAVVPRVTVVTRKAYGGAYIAMNARSLGATAVYAWPDAEVAVMGHEAAVGILHRRKLAEVDDAERPALKAALAVEHARLAGGLGRAQEIGVVDAVINPADTRRTLVQTLAAAPPARGQHGNIPL